MTKKVDIRTPRRKYQSLISEFKPDEIVEHGVKPPYDQRTVSDLHEEAKEALTYRQKNPEPRRQMGQKKKWRNQETHQMDPEDVEEDFFGKPGAGAPLAGDNKKKKFTEYDRSLTPHQDEDEKGFNSGWGKAGAGAVMRTGSGKPITSMRGNGDIRFGQKETSERYKQDPVVKQSYAQELKQQMREKKEAIKRQRDQDLQQEQEVLRTEFYGKPGGGAPVLNNSGMPSTRRSMKNVGNLEQEHNAELRPVSKNGFKLGNGLGNPLRTSSGRLANGRKGFISNELRHRDKNIHYTTIPPISPADGGDSPRAKRTYNIPDEDTSGFWNERGGAGAPPPNPRRTKNIVNISSDENMADLMRKKRAQESYMKDQKKHMAENKRDLNRYKTFDKNFTGIDFGSLMKDRSSGPGYPKRDPVTGLIKGGGLKSSDVTQSTVAPKHYSANSNSTYYHDELRREAEERYQRRELEKLKERQEEKQHSEAFDSMWGRPGGGAPAGAGTKKANLINSLHTPRYEDGRSDYNKIIDEDHATGLRLSSDFGGGNQRYVKSTIKSNSRNNFEILPEQNTKVVRKERVINAEYEE